MPLGLVPSFSSERKAIGGILRSIDNIWSHLNVEIKHNDITGSGTLTDSATFIPLTDISSGITGSTSNSIDKGYRDGDKIRVKTVNCKILIEQAPANTSTEICYAYLLKHYDNFSGVGPLFNDIFDPYTGTYLSTRLRNNDHIGQYKILQRRMLRLSGVEDKDNEKMINMYHKNKKRPGSYVEWEGTLSSDPSNGKYYLVLVSETNASSTYQYSSRVTYVDN